MWNRSFPAGRITVLNYRVWLPRTCCPMKSETMSNHLGSPSQPGVSLLPTFKEGCFERWRFASFLEYGKSSRSRPPHRFGISSLGRLQRRRKTPISVVRLTTLECAEKGRMFGAFQTALESCFTGNTLTTAALGIAGDLGFPHGTPRVSFLWKNA